MAETIERLTLVPTQSGAPDLRNSSLSLWTRIALGAIVLLASFMDFFGLGQNGYGNLYYAAGVRSMADSWHNFFFVSFDPGGFVTIDKPPLGFWLQVLSTKIFGFTAFSIFLPQAVCGVLAVLLLFFLVRRHFGVIAGLIAALALAVTPISVVTDRNNTIDGTLALALLLAAWAVINAAEKGKLRWLLLSAVFVGLGFNIKMAEAYLIVPAIIMTYLFCAPRKIWTRLWHLVLAGFVVVVLSLSWAAAVDLTPASARPYVGSTQTNSELSLAFGYNGLSRLHVLGLGGNGGVGFAGATGRGGAGFGNPGISQIDLSSTGSLFQLGSFDPLHLFSASLGGQIAWLLAFALLGLLALAWQRRLRFQQDHQQLGLVLWGFWLLTMAIFFTLDGNFHQYYMTEMAPGLCACVGIGLICMWRDYRAGGWRGWLLLFALVVTADAQIYMLTSYPTWASWLSPLIVGATALSVIALILFRLLPRLSLNVGGTRLAITVVSIGLGILLVAPTIWSGYSVVMNTESSFPTAGPNATSGFFSFGGGQSSTGGNFGRFGGGGNPGNNNTIGAFGGSTQVNQALVSYLEARQGSTTFLLATSSATSAEAIILATNRPVMALGGFSGNDPILTTSDLQSLIRQNSVHYFLLNGSGGGGRGFGGSGESTPSSWIESQCSVVPTSAWATSAGAGGGQLYDCTSSAG